MTHSVCFASVKESSLFRGVNSEQVRELLEKRRLDSPVLLLSTSEVAHNYQALAQALPRAGIHYAVKSNNHPDLLAEIHNQGGHFDVCSAREAEQVLKLGLGPKELIHTHPIKSTEEFDRAVAMGIETFVVDNPEEIKKLYRYPERRLKILIRYRINTNTRAIVDLQYKFGCTSEMVLPLAQMIQEAGHDFHGICCHIGSQCVYSDNYVQTIKIGSELIEQLRQNRFDVQMFDIGGGFPVEYVEPVPAIDEFCQPISEALDRYVPDNIKVICEPGRFISASTTTLVCSVIGKAERDGKLWYYLDDGLYSTFSGIVFDHCQYPVVTSISGEEKLSVLAGPTCDSFDVMYDGLMVPEQNVGDRIVFPMTGAYCAVSGSDFNSLKRPQYTTIR